jgi:hypothetical protein
MGSSAGGTSDKKQKNEIFVDIFEKLTVKQNTNQLGIVQF